MLDLYKYFGCQSGDGYETWDLIWALRVLFKQISDKPPLIELFKFINENHKPLENSIWQKIARLDRPQWGQITDFVKILEKNQHQDTHQILDIIEAYLSGSACHFKGH
jgi:hypothetical protein